MGMLTIRNVDDELKARLRLRAAEAGCSMEEAVRRILREATATSDSEKLSLAQQRLLDHLAQVKPIGVRDWTRDDLYD